MKGLDDHADGLNEAAFERALNSGGGRKRKARKPVANAETLHDRIRKLHCIRCHDVLTGEPKATPCCCACHLPPAVTP